MVTWKNDTKSNNNCWTETYSTNVNETSPNKEYFKRSLPKGATTAIVKYNLSLNLRQKKMIVQMKFIIDPDSENPEEVKYTKDGEKKLEQAVYQYWNNRFKLVIDDQLTNCPKCELDIIFQIIFLQDGDYEHTDFLLEVQHSSEHPNPNVERAQVDRSQMITYEKSDIWTYVHEFGHIFGLPDEYSVTDSKEVVKYIDPSGKEHPMEVKPIRDISDPQATVMSTSDDMVFKERHGWPLAIEAQKLLRANRYKNANCNIRLVR